MCIYACYELEISHVKVMYSPILLSWALKPENHSESSVFIDSMLFYDSKEHNLLIVDVALNMLVMQGVMSWEIIVW